VSTKANLEADLCDLVHMAHIVATLLEDALGDKNMHQEITRLPNTYYLNEEDADAMLFASYEVHNRLRALRNKYYSGR
jgi:hypothetical protein